MKRKIAIWLGLIPNSTVVFDDVFMELKALAGNHHCILRVERRCYHYEHSGETRYSDINFDGYISPYGWVMGVTKEEMIKFFTDKITPKQEAGTKEIIL